MGRRWKIFVISVLVVLVLTVPAYASEIVDTSNHIYTYEEMCSDMVELSVAYPGLVTYRSIGNSCDGRSIMEMVIGNPSATKSIYVQAGVHGREWMNCMLVMKQAEYSLANSASSFDDCNIHIVPMVNPDGIAISQFGLMAIRNEGLRASAMLMPGAAYPYRWKANARGVDINRNFSTGWGSVVDVLVPASENYNGTAPMTEPETIAVANTLSQTPYIAAISYHSFEGAIYWDLMQTGDLRTRTAALAMQVQATTGYRLGVVSPVKGLDYNMMIFEKNIPSVIIETGTRQCPLPYSQWKGLWKRNKNLLINLATIY